MPAEQPVNMPEEIRRRRQFYRSVPAMALRRGLGLIVLGVLVASGLATYQVAQMPPQYVVDAKLLYRFGREYFPITPTEVRRNWGENIIVSLDNALATELHLLSSYEVAATTVDGIEGGFALPSGGSPDDAQTERDRVAAFSELSTVRRVQGATMLSVAMRHTDPDMAGRMLDAFLDAYRQRRNALFHSDAAAYFEEQMAALRAQDDAIQEELGRLNTEYRNLESQARLTDWSPDRPITEDDGEMAEIQGKLAWMEGVIAQQGKRSAAVRDRMIELEQERTDWEISRAYTRQVAPVIEIVDRTPATRSDTPAQSLLRILSAGIAGGLVVWACFILALLVRKTDAARSTPPGSSRRLPPA